MKLLLRIVLVLALLVLVVVWFSGRIVGGLAKTAVEQATGFGVELGDIQVNVLRPMVRISNLKLTNPAEFPHPEALTVREAGVELAWSSLFSSTVRVRNVTLDIPRVVMVRTPEGSNLEALSKGRKKDEAGTQEKPAPTTGPESGGQPAEPAPEKPKRALLIDAMTVKFGEMEVRQYSRRAGEEPAVLTIPVNLDRSYTNVTNIEQVAAELTMELAMRSGVGLFQQLDASIKKLNEKADGKEEKIKNVINGLQEMFK